MLGKQNTKQVKLNKNRNLKTPTTYNNKQLQFCFPARHHYKDFSSFLMQRRILFLTLPTKGSCSLDADSNKEAPITGDRRKLPMPTCASWIMLTSLAPSPIASVIGFSGEVFNSRTTWKEKIKHFKIRQSTSRPYSQVPQLAA